MTQKSTSTAQTSARRKPLYLRITTNDRAFIEEQAKALSMDINTYMSRLIDQERIRVTMDQSVPLAVQAINSATEKILMAHESMRHMQEIHVHTMKTLEKLVAVDTSYLENEQE